LSLPFLDTNILLRHFTGDHHDHSPRATAYLGRVDQGEIQVQCADTVIFETAYTLEKFYGVPRSLVRDLLTRFIDLPAVTLSGKPRWHRALETFAAQSISVADAYHVALMEDLGLDTIVSLDRDFDRIAGILRVEP